MSKTRREKKLLSFFVFLIISALICSYAAENVFALYPGSYEFIIEKPQGSLLFGDMFGTESWDGSSVYFNAFDGDPDTYYDAFAAGAYLTWVGMTLESPAMLTEFRWKPRSGWTQRSVGACVQGSNDGVKWTTLLTIRSEPADEYTVITSEEFETSAYFIMFRYTQSTDTHLDVAEIEFYGEYEPVQEEEEISESAGEEQQTEGAAVSNDNRVLVISLLILISALAAGNILLIAARGKKKS